ncbi:MAG: hypothetical protein Q4G23_07825 [Clostridia bacterium]|nr:hypothetical protein [Clostridia bacterium]
MKYIIMCGGPRSERPLIKVNNEPIVARTIRLLKENGIKDIAISTNDDRYDFGVPILHHDNSLTWDDFYWLKTYYPMKKPVCYMHGDVFFSPEAIKTIVETETDSIEFFASAPPFSKQYKKNWAEPFAFKVKDTKRFFEAIDLCKELDSKGFFKRKPPITWELWQVIKGTPLNIIDYTNYTAINDYTVDVDDEGDAKCLGGYV